MKTHINAMHSGQKPFECEICKMTFAWKRSYELHVEGVHENIRRFECPKCFKSLGGLKSKKKFMNLLFASLIGLIKNILLCSYCTSDKL